MNHFPFAYDHSHHLEITQAQVKTKTHGSLLKHSLLISIDEIIILSIDFFKKCAFPNLFVQLFVYSDFFLIIIFRFQFCN